MTTEEKSAMKKAEACWNTNVSLDVECPHCRADHDIYDNYDFWEDVNDEFNEEMCDGLEFKCEDCGEIFGLKAINKE